MRKTTKIRLFCLIMCIALGIAAVAACAVDDVPVKPGISPSAPVYVLNSSGDLNFEITDAESVDAVKHGEDTLDSSCWAYEDGILTIYADYLNTLGLGEQAFSFVAGENETKFTVTCYALPSVENSVVDYSFEDGQDLTVNVNLGGASLIQVKVAGDVCLVSDYSLTDGVLTIKKSFLEEVCAKGDNEATLTTTVGACMFTIRCEFTIEATFDATTYKIQTAIGNDVVFEFDANGKEFALYEADGTKLAADAYEYNASKKTLTIKAAYIDVLAAGCYDFRLDVADDVSTSILFTVGAHGGEELDNVAFPESVYAMNNFNTLATGSSFGGTNVLKDEFFTWGATSKIVDGDKAIDGKSLQFISTSDAAAWNVIFGARPGFVENTEYLVRFKAKMELPAENASATLAVRLMDGIDAKEINALFVNLTSFGSNSLGAHTDKSYYEYDEETGVYTLYAYMTPESAGKVLHVTAVNAGLCKLTIDDFAILYPEVEKIPEIFGVSGKAIQVQTSAEDDLTWNFAYPHKATLNGLTLNGKSVAESLYNYDSENGTLTMTAENLAALGGAGAYEFVLNYTEDEEEKTLRVVAGVYTDEKYVLSDNFGILSFEDFALDSQLATNLGKEADGAKMHASGITTDRIVNDADFGKALYVETSSGGVAYYLNKFAANIAYRVRITFKLAEDDQITSLLLKWAQDNINACWIRNDTLSGDQKTGATLVKDSKTGVYVWDSYLTSGAVGGQLVFYNVGNQKYIIDSIEIFNVIPPEPAEVTISAEKYLQEQTNASDDLTWNISVETNKNVTFVGVAIDGTDAETTEYTYADGVLTISAATLAKLNAGLHDVKVAYEIDGEIYSIDLSAGIYTDGKYVLSDNFGILSFKDFALDSTLVANLGKEADGAKMHASGITTDRVVDDPDFGKALYVETSSGSVAYYLNKFAANTAYRVRITFKLAEGDQITSLLLKWIQDGIDACWIKNDVLTGSQKAGATLVKDSKTGVYVWDSYLTSGAKGGQMVFYNVGNQKYIINSIEIFNVVPPEPAEVTISAEEYLQEQTNASDDLTWNINVETDGNVAFGGVAIDGTDAEETEYTYADGVLTISAATLAKLSVGLHDVKVTYDVDGALHSIDLSAGVYTDGKLVASERLGLENFLDKTIGNTMQDIYGTEAEGAPMHIWGGTPSAVVEDETFGKALQVGGKSGVNFSFNNMAANTAYCVRITFKLNSADKISSLLLKWVQDGINACWIKDDVISGTQTAKATLVKDAKTGVYVWTSYLTAGDQGKQLAFYNVGGQSYNIGSIEIFENVPKIPEAATLSADKYLKNQTSASDSLSWNITVDTKGNVEFKGIEIDGAVIAENGYTYENGTLTVTAATLATLSAGLHNVSVKYEVDGVAYAISVFAGVYTDEKLVVSERLGLENFLDKTIGNTMQDIYGTEAEGAPMHIWGGTPSAVVEDETFGKALQVGGKSGVNFSFNNMAANTAYCVRITFKLNSADKISSLLLKWVQDGINACWIKDDVISGTQTAKATLVKDAKTGVYVWTSYLTAGDQGKQLAFYNVGGQSYNIGSIEVFEVVPETSAE